MPVLQETRKIGELRESNITKETSRVPFVFDLQQEYDLIRQYGDNYLPFFTSQVEYYMAEAYGRVPKIEYHHDIVRDENGKATLYFGPMKQKAIDSYREPLRDTSRPLWYRKRAMGDVSWVQNLEEKISNAESGDILVDLSPTEFGISLEERKKWGFGWHSFVRIHQVVKDENGNEKLVSRALRNYLDLPEQEELFKNITGRKVAGEQLLGEVEKVKPQTGPGHIERLIEILYENTPEDRKIKLPEGDQAYLSDIEMKAKLKTLRTWTERIFYLMKQGFPKSQIEKEFHGLEMMVRDYVNGKSINFDYFATLNPRSLVELTHPLNGKINPIQEYSHKEYKPPATSCPGSGSGFGEESDNSGKTKIRTGLMTYEELTKNERDYKFDQAGPCRMCGEDVPCGPCKVCEKCNDKIDENELSSGE